MKEHWLREPAKKIEFHGYTIFTQKKEGGLQEKEIYLAWENTFGTGTHSTTLIAGEMLLEELEKKKYPKVLDVGTGTGIQAILAIKNGVEKVCAVDTNPEAIKQAKINIKENGAEGITVTDGIEKVEEKYPLIIANINIAIWKKIKKEILERLEEEGTLFLTGISHGLKVVMGTKGERGYESEIINRKKHYHPYVGIKIKKIK